MIKANIKITIDVPIDKVYNKVIDFANQNWRSDLKHTEILSDSSFIEYAKDGNKTKFEIVSAKPNNMLQLKFANNYISGVWIGLFYGTGSKTTIDFTERIKCRKWWLRPAVGRKLRSMQRQYVLDLLNILEANELGSILKG